MLNMLVIIENKNLGIKLINSISESNKNIRLYNFCNNINDAINILDKVKVDFIILEVNYETLFGIEVIDFFIKENRKEYFNSIILLSNKKINNYPFIFECIEIPINLKKILNSVEKIYNYKEKSNDYISIKNKITYELKYLNYDLSHIGTKYLGEAILEIYFKKNYLGDDLKNNIYSVLAKRYNKSINTIYGDIKQATISMYANCSKDIIIDYFYFEKCKKPKVTDVIFKIINKIKKPH